MTNAEKYKEVFGLEPDCSMCPTANCDNCPEFTECHGPSVMKVHWWNEEYKESETDHEQTY